MIAAAASSWALISKIVKPIIKPMIGAAASSGALISKISDGAALRAGF